MAKKSYFGNRISPSCSYCLFGNRSREGNKVLCEKQGLVDADYSCKKWVYDPIKRVPKKQLNIPNQEDDLIHKICRTFFGVRLLYCKRSAERFVSPCGSFYLISLYLFYLRVICHYLLCATIIECYLNKSIVSHRL